MADVARFSQSKAGFPRNLLPRSPVCGLLLFNQLFFALRRARRTFFIVIVNASQ
jgi:hypothetical protein